MEYSNDNSRNNFENEGLIYTNELKALLDDRYADYKNGIKMISAEESQQEIQALLTCY